MRPRREALARAVDSIVEGSGGLDWGLMTIELDNDRDRELLRHIRLLAQISDVQRAEAGALDEAALRARARAIVSVLPSEEQSTRRREGALSATATMDLRERVVAGRWGRLELLELVGKGTFGEVYRARDSQLQREVAVKLLHVRRPHDGLVDRMLHEARALARVSTRTSSSSMTRRNATGGSGSAWSSSAGERWSSCFSPKARAAPARRP